MDLLKKIWQTWKRVGQAIGDFIGRVVLMIFYFTIFLPFGVGVRLGSDPLSMKQNHPPQWIKRIKRDATLENARRQF